ncbi:MAG TPA: ChbG/HpnK family deacetylase [Tahibacter sp.]|uniref:carbohydrate deacetylase n=1 Tax=Tahibacter sp. TaxID=2056211 RepID=UPI002C8A6BF4|nr:ChbG/HpnK family deacetylase [Tahibacter sp.]HSX59229.1 ChbG/HpnK family deacetylase [Tahibacter sp.]
MRRLIVNADDFGITAGVNAAVIDAFRAGCLSSATLLVNGAAAREAADLARAHPRLGIGLHFNLTLGAPSAPADAVPSLLGADGRFPSRDEIAKRALRGRLVRSELHTELKAQLAAFVALGLAPTHLDSHQHVHAFPPVFDTLAQECAALGLPLRQPHTLRLPGARPRLGRRLRSSVLALLNWRNAQRWKGRVRSNRAFASVFDFGHLPSRLEPQHYGELFANTQGDPLELMVHLVRDADDVDGLTRIGDVAVAEWELLSRGALVPLMAEHGFRLCTYAEAFELGHP